MKMATMWGLIGLANFAVGNLIVGFACIGCQLAAAVMSLADTMTADDEE